MSLTRWFHRAPDSAARPSARLTVEALEARENPAGGLFDPTFGTDGVALLPVASGEGSHVYETAVQPDGKIVTVGYHRFPAVGRTPGYDRTEVTRLNPDGSLDTTFGTGGRVLLVLPGVAGYGHALALQPDGKILASALSVATSGKGKDAVTSSQYAVVRLNPNGSLDTSFGNSSGWWLYNTSAYDYVDELAVVPSGASFSIYVGGSGGTPSGVRGAVVVKLDAIRHPVTSYGSGGFGVFPNSSVTATEMSVTPSGRAILLGGNTILAFNAAGQPDTNFNGTGVVRITNTDPVRTGLFGMVTQGESVLVSGNHSVDGGVVYRGVVIRYTSVGVVDPTFGVGGVYLTPEGMFPRGTIMKLAVAADGSIYSAGYFKNPAAPDVDGLMFARLSADGVADTSFGPDGTGFSLFTGPTQETSPRRYMVNIDSLTLDSAGNLVVGGRSTTAWNKAQGSVIRITGS